MLTSEIADQLIEQFKNMSEEERIALFERAGIRFLSKEDPLILELIDLLVRWQTLFLRDFRFIDCDCQTPITEIIPDDCNSEIASLVEETENILVDYELDKMFAMDKKRWQKILGHFIEKAENVDEAPKNKANC